MNKNLFVIGVIFLISLSCFFQLLLVQGAKLLYSNSYSNEIQLNADTPNIMLTGYWNPTGQMILPFSTDNYLNPSAWIGGNWENRGYNIYSFFPTPGEYNGTLEVDYQDTWNDFWRITEQIRPVAIISFGADYRSNFSGSWEIEFNSRNLNRWYNDEKFPFQPTPCPPDNSVPSGYTRHSTLPVQKIADSINELTTHKAWVDWEGNPEGFLCEYMAYLGMWYQSLNENNFLYPCKASGFIHVDGDLPVEDAMDLTKITIRETINFLSNIENIPEEPTIRGTINGAAKKEYRYKFKTNDPNKKDVKYFISWGDNTQEWTNYYSSGKEITVKHVWKKTGDYKVKAIAMNSEGLLSPWGSLEITMPKNKLSINPFFSLKFKQILNPYLLHCNLSNLRISKILFLTFLTIYVNMDIFEVS